MRQHWRPEEEGEMGKVRQDPGRPGPINQHGWLGIRSFLLSEAIWTFQARKLIHDWQIFSTWDCQRVTFFWIMWSRGFSLPVQDSYDVETAFYQKAFLLGPAWKEDAKSCCQMSYFLSLSHIYIYMCVCVCAHMHDYDTCYRIWLWRWWLALHQASRIIILIPTYLCPRNHPQYVERHHVHNVHNYIGLPYNFYQCLHPQILPSMPYSRREARIHHGTLLTFPRRVTRSAWSPRGACALSPTRGAPWRRGHHLHDEAGRCSPWQDLARWKGRATFSDLFVGRIGISCGLMGIKPSATQKAKAAKVLSTWIPNQWGWVGI